MFTIVSILIFVVDQLLKIAVHRFMQPGQSIQLIPNILHLTYVQNKGAAFGLFFGFRNILLLIGIIVVVFILYFNARLRKKNFLHLPLAMVLGGSLGNLADRLYRSFVIDYLDLKIWPVFNLADIMINLGFAFIVFRLFFPKSRHHDHHYPEHHIHRITHGDHIHELRHSTHHVHHNHGGKK